MMWVLAAIGFIAGGIAGLMHDFSPVYGALLGWVLGFLIGRTLDRGKHPAGTTASAPRRDEPPGTLAERVARLEATVEALTQEVAQLRGQSAHASTTAPPPAVPVQPLPEPQQPAAQPAATRDAYAIPPQGAVPASVSRTVTSAQPAGPIAPPATPASATAGTRNTHKASASREPDLADRVFRAARDWLLGGNTVVRVGMIVLFFGVAFLLKYAADNSMLPIEFRLAGAALGATALLAAGWRIGARRAAYGLVLQGGGVGMLYLTVFAATRLYHLLPAGAAFPLMVAICALSAFLAVRQNASPLAFMGSAGGFLAPVLLASGGGSHVVLFTYYALLNAGILAIAWFKAWRPLNLLGFVFTFTLGSAWGVTAYRPELLASTEPFLILFFVMYVGIALLYAVHREIALKHYVDGTLVFGTPIVAIALQAALMKHVAFGLAWSAVALAAFYLAVAAWLARRRDRLGLLFDAMLALAVIFATLAVPLAFTGPTTSAAWAIEGAAIVWVAVRERRLAPFGFGLLMQLAAAGAFVAGMLEHPAAATTPVLNGAYIATLMIALAGLFTGCWLHGRGDARAWHAWMPEVGLAAAGWGLLWWIGGGLHEIVAYADAHVDANRARFTLDAIALFAASTAWLAHAARRKLAWPLAEWPALALVPALTLLAVRAFELDEAPLTGLGALAWPIVIASVYALLWRQQRDTGERAIAPLHALMFWNLCGLLALEGFWRLRAFVPEGAWSWSAWAYGFGLMLLLVSGAGARLRWPVARFAHAYQVWGAAPLAALLWAWSIASTQSDGDASPLVWLPLLNPLDVAQLLAFLAVATWLRRLKALGVPWHTRAVDYAALATVFLWFNALLLRTLHDWADVPYTIDDMARSTLAQASVSVFWTVWALATMIWATRSMLRPLWFVGAALLALTVVKLFLFDLSHLQGIERIVSFIGIGTLLLLIGYFSPLPPKAKDLTEGSP
ncbi:conserved membrane protein of unknown function [Burkholderia multivorans]